MCDYSRAVEIDSAEIMPAGTGKLTHNVYCQRASQFWVQSLTSHHNMHACAQHLARIVREVEKGAKKYDILDPAHIGEEGYHPHYVRSEQRMTRKEGNYAHVTVKPYAPKGK